MKKLSIFLMLALFLIGSVVSASAFSIGGYTGAFKMKYSNWEDLNLPAANLPGGTSYFDDDGDGIEDNFGILYISEIRADDGTNALLWSDGTSGETLTGLFYDVDVQSWSTDGISTNIQSTGGKMDIYLDTTPGPTFNANQGLGGYIADADGIAHNDYTGITDIGSALFLTLDFVPGVDPLTDAAIDGDFDGSTLPSTGDASSYLSVTGGVYANMFDTNGFNKVYTDDILGAGTPITPDLFAQNDFVSNDGSTAPIQGDWQLLSEDPVRGLAAPIPEPSTMMLFGFGLLAMGFVGRKKLNKKD